MMRRSWRGGRGHSKSSTKKIQAEDKKIQADIQVKEEKVQKGQSLLQKQVIDLKGEKEILQQQLEAKDNLLQELRRLREKEVMPLQQQVTDLQEQLDGLPQNPPTTAATAAEGNAKEIHSSSRSSTYRNDSDRAKSKVDQKSSLQQQIVRLKSTLMAKDSQLEKVSQKRSEEAQLFELQLSKLQEAIFTKQQQGSKLLFFLLVFLLPSLNSECYNMQC